MQWAFPEDINLAQEKRRAGTAASLTAQNASDKTSLLASLKTVPLRFRYPAKGMPIASFTVPGHCRQHFAWFLKRRVIRFSPNINPA
jgi:hypothetical protein